MSCVLTAALVVAAVVLGTTGGNGQDSLSLIERARKISDIRSENAPAFKLSDTRLWIIL
jgi:hypothetical protein